MANTITITGQLGKDPELRFTPSGSAVLNGTVADTPRRFNRETQQWEDAGDTLWLNWSIFGADAEHLAELLTKGSKVTIVGRVKARTYQTRDGEQRTVNEISADSIAAHAPKQGGGYSKPQESRGGDDPWQKPHTDKAPF